MTDPVHALDPERETDLIRRISEQGPHAAAIAILQDVEDMLAEAGHIASEGSAGITSAPEAIQRISQAVPAMLTRLRAALHLLETPS